jgi:hypothetical protein
MSVSSIKSRIAALERKISTATQLPANFVDPIAAMLRARISAGVSPTPPATPERIEKTRATLVARLEEAGRRARARAWA